MGGEDEESGTCALFEPISLPLFPETHLSKIHKGYFMKYTNNSNNSIRINPAAPWGSLLYTNSLTKIWEVVTILNTAAVVYNLHRYIPLHRV